MYQAWTFPPVPVSDKPICIHLRRHITTQMRIRYSLPLQGSSMFIVHLYQAYRWPPERGLATSEVRQGLPQINRLITATCSPDQSKISNWQLISKNQVGSCQNHCSRLNRLPKNTQMTLTGLIRQGVIQYDILYLSVLKTDCWPVYSSAWNQKKTKNVIQKLKHRS